jgi:hypothetical protein
MKEKLSIVVMILMFQNCNSTNISKNQPNDPKNNKINFFRFLIDDLKGEDIREKYICMYPKFVNIEFQNDTSNVFEQKYPNPCSPSMIANFILYVKSPNSKLQINILNNSDSLISTYMPTKLEKGYYAFYSEEYIRNNMSNAVIYEQINRVDSKYSVEFKIDSSKYKLDLKRFR